MKVSTRYGKRNNSGFSLIELLSVVAIMGILYAIIIPAYQQQIAKARRSDGQSLLFEIQTQIERYRFDFSVYPEALSQMTRYTDDQVESKGAYYSVSLEKGGGGCELASCYVLKAEPQNGQEHDGPLELHSNGERIGPW